MRTIIKFTVIGLLLLLLGGCWDRTEINDLALITALALDQTENGQIQATVQIIIPQNQGGMNASGGNGSHSKPVTTRSEHGANITEALSKLQRVMSRKQFWGQCKIFIFSEKLAKSGIREQFDFLVRHPQPRERAYMLVSKGKAADALEVFPPIERSSADALRKFSDMNIGIKVTLEQLSMMLKGDSRTAALPLVYILPENKSAEPYQTIPYIFGTAVFKKDKMIGEISEMTTRGVLWIRNEIEEYTVTYKAEEGEGLVSLHPVKASLKLIPKIQGDRWGMTIKVFAEADIVQNGTDLNPFRPDLLNTMNEAFKQDVRERIHIALDEVQHRLQADIFNFAREFHRTYPKQWEKAKDRWDDIFPEVKVEIDIKTLIHRPGNINSPGGMPKEEVRQQ